MLKNFVSFLTQSRVSFFCSKKEISIQPHVWSIKMMKLGNYFFFLKIDYSANFVGRNSSWRKNKVKQKCLRKYGITSLLHQHYVHWVTYTYGTSFRILPFYKRLERQGATSGLMHRICGLWLGSKFGVWPAVSPFVVFTKKYLQLLVAPPLRLRLNGQIVLKTQMVYFQILSCVFALI